MGYELTALTILFWSCAELEAEQSQTGTKTRFLEAHHHLPRSICPPRVNELVSHACVLLLFAATAKYDLASPLHAGDKW
jgi:hypothetical protein